MTRSHVAAGLMAGGIAALFLGMAGARMASELPAVLTGLKVVMAGELMASIGLISAHRLAKAGLPCPPRALRLATLCCAWLPILPVLFGLGRHLLG